MFLTLFRFVAIASLQCTLIAASSCPSECHACDTRPQCHECSKSSSDGKCKQHPKVRKSENICGEGCLRCCEWSADHSICMHYKNGTRGIKSCPPSITINSTEGGNKSAEGHDDDDRRHSSVQHKPQGPIIGMFLLFCLFVATVALRERYRRRRLLQNSRLAENAPSFRSPPPLRTASVPTNTDPTNPATPQMLGRVVVVMGPSGEMEVGVKDPPLPNIAMLSPMGPMHHS